MILVHAALVLPERDVQDPMETIFNLPMTAHDLEQLRGLGGKLAMK